jgi:Tol biopolymer transport system component
MKPVPKVTVLVTLSIVTALLAYLGFGGISGGRWARYSVGGRYAGARPQLSPVGRLVYSSPRSGRGDIYRSESDGSNTRRLTSNPNYEGDPAWSPSGERIAFIREEGGMGHLWLMNADGSDQTQLTHDAGYVSRPSFSRDGSRISFRREHPWRRYIPGAVAGSTGLFTIGTDGTDEIQMMELKVTGESAVLSPDGTKVLLSTNVFSLTGAVQPEIWVMNVDDRKRHFLAEGGSPSWSPNSTSMVFLHDPDDRYQYDIFLMDVETRRVQRITHSGGYKSSPSFSSDGKHIVFLCEPTASGTGSITIVELSTMMVTDGGRTD